MSRVTRLLAVVAPAALAACVVVPRETSHYDDECKMTTRQMTLEAKQVWQFGNCIGGGCVGLLVMYGGVAAASAVVSGSVVVVGNVVYWLERKATCADRAEQIKRASTP